MAKRLDRYFYIITILAILLAQVGVVPVNAADNIFTVSPIAIQRAVL